VPNQENLSNASQNLFFVKYQAENTPRPLFLMEDVLKVNHDYSLPNNELT
jgi:hypothetical protein